MTHTYIISGMTCEGCRSSVHQKLSSINGVSAVEVDLENHRATLTMEQFIPVSSLQEVLRPSYTIADAGVTTISARQPGDTSKWRQLRPLFLILSGIWVLALLLNSQTFQWSNIMLDYMGLFFIVFSGFKMLDLKGFSVAFAMYDPLAKRSRSYAKIYPFIELIMGVAFMLRLYVPILLVLTLLLLGITTIGVIRSLVSKQGIRCACLGTVLNLPMTEATFIENAIMLVMAIVMLLNLV